MSDFHDLGRVRIIALKKVGSSTLNRAFREQRFDDNQPVRFVTYVRHPAARLVSAWNHFVAVNNQTRFTYEDRENLMLPALPFYEWVEVVLQQDLLSLDHHLRPQAPEIYDRIAKAPLGSRLFIGQLEQANAKIDALVAYVGRSVRFDTGRKHPHAPWHTFYDKRLLENVRGAFAADMALWMAVFPDGYWISDPKAVLSETLTFAYNRGLTNGEQCVRVTPHST